MSQPSSTLPKRRNVLLWLLTPLALGLQACAQPNTAAIPAISPLWDTEWRLQALGDQPVIESSGATLGFYDVGQVGGNGSCNRFFSTITVEQDRMQFGPIGSTKMACMGPAMAQESRYLAALKKAQRYELQGDTLLIHVDGMAQPLRFVRAP